MSAKGRSSSGRKYKALILDVDGTLSLPSSGREANIPTPKVTQAITKAQKKMSVGIATARPLSMVEKILSHVQFNGYSILQNGAQIIDGNQQAVWKKPIEPQSLPSIFSTSKKHKVPIYASTFTTHLTVTKRGQLTSQTIAEVYFDDIPDGTMASIENDLSRLSNVSTHRIVLYDKPRLQGLQITHIEATKQHAILHVAKLLKIKTKEIIGVGDGPNDFPLLMACGLRVAMGNAVPELKAIADFIAPSVEEDGVATVIEKFILSR